MAFRGIVNFPNTIYFRQHKWITKLLLTTQQSKVYFSSRREGVRVRKCLFCVAGLYVGPWFVGSVFKASSERSVPSGISAVMWERCVSSASSRLSLALSVLRKGTRKNSSWEGERINALCQLIGQWVTDSLNWGIDSRKEIDLWLLHHPLLRRKADREKDSSHKTKKGTFYT